MPAYDLEKMKQIILQPDMGSR